MNYVYIDESGNTGTKGQFIVFASITTKDPKELEKFIKKIWRAKPQFHPLGELHAKEVDDATRKRVLSQLGNLPITVHYKLLNKPRTGQRLLNTYYVELANFCSYHSKSAHSVIVDKKDTDARRRLIIRKLGLQHAFRKVVFEESHHIKQLQAVDFVAWSLGRLYEHGDSSYYDLIRHKESPSL